MKQGAIFDMDGLLFDTERLFQQGWTHTAHHFGQTPHPDFPVAVAGTSGEKMLEGIRQFYPTVDAQTFRNYCYDHVAECLKRHVPERPGMREILAFFKAKGVKMAVASGSMPDMVLGNLDHAGIRDYFDAIVCASDVKHGKPAPDTFLLAAERLRLAPADCYVLEDGVNGVKAGIAAGCATIMIPDLYHAPAELANKCAGIYPSLIEAMHAIEQNQI